MKRAMAVVSLLVILGLVNLQIWQKERHLARGERVFLQLAPVDPRSLMQGDYMALRFAVGLEVRAALRARGADLDGGEGYVVVSLDERSVASFDRLWDDQPLADNQRRLFYRVRHGRVRFATNAYFFQEGEGDRYQRAEYGLFRVNPDGRVLLQTLVDDSLQSLDPESP